MARNRKRRGDSGPPDADPGAPGSTRTRATRGRGNERAEDERIGSRVDDTSDPLGHAAPDAELAEAQLAAGEAAAERLEGPVLGPEVEMPGLTSAVTGPVPGEGGEVFPDERVGADEGESAERRPARRRTGVLGFMQGSWRELQRVQWPDQRQVVQATGVVIGFVIVAGAFLGLADFVATKLVNFIFS